MHALGSPRPHVHHLVRVSVVALLAGLLHVLSVTPASAAVPTGVVDVVESVEHGRVHLRGWAYDPAAPGVPVDIHVYFGPPGADYGYNLGPANTYRPDVNAAYGVGDNHGFDTVIDVPISGDYEWRVYAIDPHGGGNPQIGKARVSVYRDTTPPQTTITSAPKTATPQDTVHVTFSANEQNATFECRWDEQPWFACQGGTQVQLTPGNHMVSVRATDQYGNTDATPATFVVAVSASATPPPPPPPPVEAERSVAAQTVKRKSRLRIDVDPDSASSNYRVVIQRKVGKTWRKVARARTRGAHDVVVVNLRRGKYRVVLPKNSQWPALRSSAVRLRR